MARKWLLANHLRAMELSQRRAWDSNPQHLAVHHISSVAASHSLTLQDINLSLYRNVFGARFNVNHHKLRSGVATQSAQDGLRCVAHVVGAQDDAARHRAEMLPCRTSSRGTAGVTSGVQRRPHVRRRFCRLAERIIRGTSGLGRCGAGTSCSPIHSGLPHREAPCRRRNYVLRRPATRAHTRPVGAWTGRPWGSSRR